MQFDWDEHNIAHIWRHRVLPEEAEQAVLIAPVDISFEVEKDEERFQMLGLTSAGRLLSAFITIRYDKIRVVTAFPATPFQRRVYFTTADFPHGQ